MSTNEGGRNPLDEPWQITFDVARIFYPLRSVASSLWRTSLQTMRQRFAEAARNRGRLACVLTQSIKPEWPTRTDPLNPPGTTGMEEIGGGYGLCREPWQLFIRTENGNTTLDSNFGRQFQTGLQLKILQRQYGAKSQDGKVEWRPAVANRAACNADGKPIVFSDGEPVALQLGASRKYIIYAEGLVPDKPLCLSFSSTATEVGRCLYGLPADVNRILWRDWLDGFDTVSDEALWINALFELAWQRIPGSPLVAKKFAWSGSLSVPLDALPRLRRQANRSALMAGLADIPDPPTHWYSVLENLFSASVAAIDVLLAIGDEFGNEPNKPAAAVKQDHTAELAAGARTEPLATEREPLTPPADLISGSESNRFAILAKLQASHRKAYLSFLYAEAKNERRLQDQDAYDWLTENGIDAETGELADYSLPQYSNWSRYLRVARNATGEQKYVPRTKRKPSD